MKSCWGTGILVLAVLAAMPAFAGPQPGAPYYSVQVARAAGRADAVQALQPLKDAPYARAEKRASGYLIRIGAWATRAEAEAASAEYRAKYGAAVKVLQLEHPVDWVLASGGTSPARDFGPPPAAPVAQQPAAQAPAQVASAPAETVTPKAEPAEPAEPFWTWKGPIGYPGDTWGRVTQDLSGKSGTGISTFISQGIDWFQLPGDIVFDTYAEYRYSKRTRDNRYFDGDGPALGLVFVRAPFRLGAEYIWERQSQLSNNRGRTGRGYLNWYQDWYTYMRKHGDEDQGYQIIGLSGSTWGKVNQDRNGLAISGFVNEGIDWFQLPWDTTFNTYAEIRWGFRTKDNDYFNAFGPAIGAELQRAPFHFGMDYYWEHYTELKETDPQWRLYLVWYYNWDLAQPFRNPFE
jgi:hypothetical protein